MNNYRSPDGLPTDLCIFTLAPKPVASKRKSLPQLEFQVLLIQRSEESRLYPNQWSFPGGFSKEDETLFESALRQLKEETSIGDDVHLKQLGAYYTPSETNGWIPTIAYYALVPYVNFRTMETSTQVTKAKLVPVEEAMHLSLAFDHNDILRDAVKRIRFNMLTTILAKEFLADEFTIAELINVVQTVVPGLDIDKANFLKGITSTKKRQGVLEPICDANGQPKKSNQYSQAPAKLYRFTGYEPFSSIYNAT